MRFRPDLRFFIFSFTFALAFFIVLSLFKFFNERSDLKRDLVRVEEYLSALDVELLLVSGFFEGPAPTSCQRETLTRLRRVVFSSQLVTDIQILDAERRPICSTTIGILPPPKPEAVYAEDQVVTTALSEDSRAIRFVVGPNPALPGGTRNLMILKGAYALTINTNLLFSDSGTNSEISLIRLRGQIGNPLTAEENTVDMIFSPSESDDTLVSALGTNSRRVFLSDTFCVAWTTVCIIRSKPRIALMVATECLPGGDACLLGTRPLLRVADGGLQSFFISLTLGLIAGALAAYIVQRLEEKKGSMKAKLLAALERGELFAVYQPLVDLETGKLESVEALIRWIDVDGQFISPEVFCGLAEEQGLSDKITDYVMAYTAEHFWTNPTFRTVKVGFNISAAEIIAPDFLKKMEAFVKQRGLEKQLVKLEATERIGVDINTFEQALENLADAGFNVSIDDFGTGHASFPYLRRLKIKAIKLDRSFVQSANEDSAYGRMLPHLVDMIRTLDVQLVIEGVETEAQMQWFKDRIHAVGQGWYFAKPLKVGDLKDWTDGGTALSGQAV